jgi:signal transduction histidine kinase
VPHTPDSVTVARARTAFLRTNLWKAQLAFTVALGGAYFLARNTPVAPAIYNLASLSACVAFVVGPIIHRCRAIQWWLFAGAMGLFAIADAIWETYVLTAGEAPYPSIADAFYLVAYPLFFIGVLVLIRGTRPRKGDVLDGLMVATAAAFLIWSLLIEPIANQADSEVIARVVTAAYPTMEVLLVIGLATLLFASRVRSFSYLALLGGFLLMAASDLIYAVLILKGQYAAGDWIDYGWIASYGMLGVAALHPSLPRIAQLAPERRGSLGKGRLAIIGTALGVAPLLALGFYLTGNKGLELEMPIASIIALTLVLLRVSHLWHERQGAETALRESESGYRILYDLAESAREQVTAQNEQLLELDKMKDEFVALISHELRTPLTSIRGYVELLRDDLPNAPLEQQDKFLAVVERNADRLLSLVNDLLLMAQIEVGKLDLHYAETDLVSLAEECVVAARPVAEERQIEVTIDARARPLLSADRPRLAQVLDNLLANALKFTPPGGQVEIRVMTDEDIALFEIRDTGMGISAEDLQHLFSSFFRTSTASAAAVPGTGLGLAISKGIVEAHGGSISAESEEGHGSTFRIELPYTGALANESLTAALVS